MSAKNTIRKAVCDKCGDVARDWYIGREHRCFEGACGGTYVDKKFPKEVISGEFEFVRSYGNTVYLKHAETGRQVNIYTVDLLKILVGRGLGRLVLTESKHGREHCWKAEEVTANDSEN
jgi:hypothetical protein